MKKQKNYHYDCWETERVLNHTVPQNEAEKDIVFTQVAKEEIECSKCYYKPIKKGEKYVSVTTYI